MPIIYFVVAIIVLIVLHEAGHAWVAHRRGMRVTDFSLFFGPAVWSRHIRGTLFAVRIIPLGGYIKVAGMGGTRNNLWNPVDVDVWSDTDGTIEDAAELAAARGVTDAPKIAARARQVVGAPSDAHAWRQAATEVLGEPTDPHSDAWTVLNGDQGRSFDDAAPWSRFLVAAGGPVANVLIAIVLLSAVNLFAYESAWHGELSSVQPGGPGAAAGLEPGDRVTAVNDVPLGHAGGAGDSDPRVATSDQVAHLAARFASAEPLTLTIERDGTETAVTLPEGERGPLGIGIAAEVDAVWQPSNITSTFVGETSMWAQTRAMLDVIASLLNPQTWLGLIQAAVGDATTPGGITSVVGAASVSNEALAVVGLLGFLQVAGTISLSLGVFNAVPVPPLDGWLMAHAGVEGGVNRVRRGLGRDGTWKVPATALNVAGACGLFALLALMGLVIAADLGALAS